MPTDEQRMRERFEGMIVGERFWRQPAEKFDPTELLARDDVGGYANGHIHERWLGWVAGQQARDAEVQALREALEQIAWLCDNSGHADATSGLLEVEAIALAALAGGKTGETE